MSLTYQNVLAGPTGTSHGAPPFRQIPSGVHALGYAGVMSPLASPGNRSMGPSFTGDTVPGPRYDVDIPEIPGGGVDFPAPDNPCDDSSLTLAERLQLGCVSQDPMDPCDSPWLSDAAKAALGCNTVSAPRFGDDCVELPLPDDWGQCLPKRKILWFINTPFPIYEEELLERCGAPPCRYPGFAPGQADRKSASTQYHDRLDDPVWSEIVSCAWALLSENLEFINWLECVVTGNESGGKCLRDAILGKATAVNPLGKVGVHLGNRNEAFPGRINLLPASSMTSKWKNGTRADRECVCVAVAGALLHELWHVCGNTIGDSEKNYPCSKAMNLQNSFQWAMSYWYPACTYSPECADFQDPSLWYNTDYEVAWGLNAPF